MEFEELFGGCQSGSDTQELWDPVLWAPFSMSHLTHLAGPPQGISGQETRRDCGSVWDRQATGECFREEILTVLSKTPEINQSSEHK